MTKFVYSIQDDGHGQAFTLIVRGQLDLTDVDSLRFELRQLMEHDGECVVDLRGVEFIDPAALAVLIEAKRTQESIRLVGSPEVARVFHRAGVSGLLAIAKKLNRHERAQQTHERAEQLHTKVAQVWDSSGNAKRADH